MGRKKKDVADAMPNADVTADLIAVAIDESAETLDAVATETAVDALDAARDNDVAEEAPDESAAPKRRGRPAGSRNNKPRGAADGDMPKTKKDLQAYAERLKAERDDARAKADAQRAQTDAEAIDRLAMSLAAGGQMIGSFMASRRGAHWKLSKEESDTMGAAWATCLAPYADSIGNALPWAVAIGVTYSIFAERVQIDQAAAGEVSSVENVARELAA